MKDIFPLLASNPGLVYFDNASTSLKPQAVVDSLASYYTSYGVNVHRGQYAQAVESTTRFESAREAVAHFIHAESSKEIVFTKNATEALNMVARMLVSAGKKVAVSPLNHHSHYVPWTEMARQHGANIVTLGLDEHGDVDVHVNEQVDVYALTYVSNVTGRIQPLKDVIKQIRARSPHAYVCVDATQALAHIPVDVQDLDCDMVAFSGHKTYGPLGIGVLWCKLSLLQTLEPVVFGGGMVGGMRDGRAIWSEVPHAFEAGTPPIAEAIALHEALEWLGSVGYDHIATNDRHAYDRIAHIIHSIDSDALILGEGSPYASTGIVSWHSPSYHAHDMAEMLGEDMIAVRAGHHCAIPLHTHFSCTSTVRASVSCATTPADFDAFEQAFKRAYTKLCPSTTQ